MQTAKSFFKKISQDFFPHNINEHFITLKCLSIQNPELDNFSFRLNSKLKLSNLNASLSDKTGTFHFSFDENRKCFCYSLNQLYFPNPTFEIQSYDKNFEKSWVFSYIVPFQFNNAKLSLDVMKTKKDDSLFLNFAYPLNLKGFNIDSNITIAPFIDNIFLKYLFKISSPHIDLCALYQNPQMELYLHLNNILNKFYVFQDFILTKECINSTFGFFLKHDLFNTGYIYNSSEKKHSLKILCNINFAKIGINASYRIPQHKVNLSSAFAFKVINQMHEIKIRKDKKILYFCDVPILDNLDISMSLGVYAHDYSSIKIGASLLYMI